jgi:hypothetical protein
MQDAFAVANDVSQAMYDVLTSNFINPEHYHLDLVPADGSVAGEEAWNTCLIQIFSAIRERHPLLPPRPTRAEVRATWRGPLQMLRELLVGKILAPSPRLTNRRKGKTNDV